MEKGAAKKTHKKNKSSSDKDISSEDDGSVPRGPLILGKIIADSIQKKCEVFLPSYIAHIILSDSTKCTLTRPKHKMCS